ncbi:ATP-binding cassette domain-containing protein [Pseudoflavonifractor sp. 60]|uniref:ATP-binding cassette domain-containing protein n=1 Tax=Pseudoflavonifractor sp. 60 TaxID=2304576 RepID=UPI001370F511|nr:ATP-binding cassette domain-containing protein [Pseudoflavonifractor sp. 60]NBI65887.1 ATP-binding cassette domain-containing protein [Pseudoflavonifractor sp. 60]
MAVIQTMGLSKRYKDNWAVDRLDLRVEQGDIYGFIGRNGAGKSTTLKLLCGLAQPTQGEALIFGKPIQDSVARRRVGALIEQPGLYPDLSGRENLRLYATLLGLDSPVRQVDEILETVGLSPKEKKPVKHYSMGMKQRLGVGLALLGGPDLLLLDEPINGLDPEGIREMRELLLRLNRERGLTLLISSHILGELSKIATRYGIIQQGRMVEQITAGELAQKCTDYLHLQADQPQKAAALLERELHLKRWEMRPEGEIRIYEAVDTKAVGQILTQAGIAVEEMGLHRQDLESYFLERMGGADHV